MPTDNVLVSTRGLCKRFKTRVATGKGWQKKTVNAVTDVSLDIVAGETLALVGESGCGKTTLGRMLSLFYKPSEGDLSLKGENIAALTAKQVKPLRRHVQMIFQDPMSSLNPRHTIEAILTEPLKFFSSDNAQLRREKAVELLEAVGLSERSLRKYPHEFSGGQRQRIVIARALILHPAFVVADEPVSALDVSVQSQILNLLKDLREQFNLTYLFISHDLAVVHHLADRVAVMYLGRIVEVGERDNLFQNPRHPYTQALLSSVPGVVPNKSKIGKVLHGDPPSPISPPQGCPFHPRCPQAQDQCRKTMPALEVADSASTHQVACHFAEQVVEQTVIEEVVQL
ncbi:dipeptide ABC transporter ATP-binding protein [bacterium SCSIO 12696]|nr:dipeptide ABC transporter ATP-binding protein [bacterium SCSIO 12696]